MGTIVTRPSAVTIARNKLATRLLAAAVTGGTADPDPERAVAHAFALADAVVARSMPQRNDADAESNGNDDAPDQPA